MLHQSGKPLLIVSGIPEEIHVRDLRRFFAPALEARLFACFHFRRSRDVESAELCCAAVAENEDAAVKIERGFDAVPWREILIDGSFASLGRAQCHIQRGDPDVIGKQRPEDLRPPPLLPRGNVGTPRKEALALVSRCMLPGSMVRRLGLDLRSLELEKRFAECPPPRCWTPKHSSERSSVKRSVSPAHNGTVARPLENKCLASRNGEPSLVPTESIVALDEKQEGKETSMRSRTHEMAGAVSFNEKQENEKEKETGISAVLPLQKNLAGFTEEQEIKEEEEETKKGSIPLAVFKSRQCPAKRPGRVAVTKSARMRQKQVAVHRQSSDKSIIAKSKARRTSKSKGISSEDEQVLSDDSSDGLPQPLGHAEPHYERTDRLDSTAGYLFEDDIEDIWDKKDASGLVHYTDAAYWDRQAGDFWERTVDDWDVESEESETRVPGCLGRNVSDDEEYEKECRDAIESLPDQSSGLAAVRRGPAGRIMQKWNAKPPPEGSATLLAILEGTQPNLTGTGIGWDPQVHSRVMGRTKHLQRGKFQIRNGERPAAAESKDGHYKCPPNRKQIDSEYIRIGSIYDKPTRRRARSPENGDRKSVV